MTSSGKIRKKKINTQMSRKPQYQSFWPVDAYGGKAAMRSYPSFTLSMPMIRS